jgi:hypothetical protein
MTRSEMLEAETLAPQGPDAPVYFRVKENTRFGGNLTLEWGEPGSTGGQELAMYVLWSNYTDPAESWELKPAVREKIIIGLRANTEYHFRSLRLSYAAAVFALH